MHRKRKKGKGGGDEDKGEHFRVWVEGKSNEFFFFEIR
jgi:hypothetical protein